LSTTDPIRHMRRPVEQTLFDQKTLITAIAPARQWTNLRWAVYATDRALFYASRSARLTPSSGTVDCLYLAPSERTAFLELYGDKLHLAREADEVPIIEANDFAERVFIDVDLPELKLVDLTTGEGIERIDLDLGTLYAPDPDFPREFAERVVTHPAKVDGFLYESRHTKEICAAIWKVHRPELAGAHWGNQRTLGSTVKHTLGDMADVFGSRIRVAS
jgi:hypothetical protein